MTLTEFLTARLDEEHAAAQAAYDRPSGYRILGTPETEDHFALWKPLRVLADVDAKRRIVHGLALVMTWNGRDDERPIPGEYVYALRRTLRLLALPYADHEDFQEEWRS